MAKLDYKTLYSKLTGSTLEKVKTFINKHHAKWDVEEFDGMINDVLQAESSTPEDVVDILALIVEQQGGNPEFKRAFFTLKAEVIKSTHRSIPPVVVVIPDIIPPIEDVDVDDE